MTNYVCPRFKKLHGFAEVRGASAHNARTANTGHEHATNHAPRMGGGAQLIAGVKNAEKALRDRLAQLAICPRKGAVIAIEVMMSVSLGWLTTASDEERRAWRDVSLGWVSELFGPGNVLQAVLHDDEDATHLHVLVVPVVRKVRRMPGRHRKGENHVEAVAVVETWGLAAADWLDGRVKLSKLQDDYAAAVSHLGLRRGNSAWLTGARHQDAGIYRKTIGSDREAAAGLGKWRYDAVGWSE